MKRPDRYVSSRIATSLRQGRERRSQRPKLPPRDVRRAPHELLLDPTYYRLTFQLAAQRANRICDEKGVGRRSSDERGKALRDAAELAENVQRTLAWLDWVEMNSTWQWRRLLTPKERRLQRFLLATVRPSIELLTAGLQIYDNGAESADERVDRLLRRRGSVAVIYAPVTRWARVEVIPWSARALYSLACYECAHAKHVAGGECRSRLHKELMAATGREAREGGDDAELVAVWALRQAFRVAHDRQRREFVRWSQDDPALRFVREHPRTEPDFKALITRYQIVTPPAAANTAEQTGKRAGKAARRKR